MKNHVLFTPQMTNMQDIISLMSKDSHEVKKEEEEHLFYNHGCILLNRNRGVSTAWESRH